MSYRTLSRRRMFWVLAWVPFGAGCPRPPEPSPVTQENQAPLPMSQAIRLVNDNLDRIEGTVQALGRVKARLRTSQGRVRHFDLSGVMLYFRSDHFSLDLKDDLLGSQVAAGSNPTHYWYYNKLEDDSYWRRPHDALVHGKDPDLPFQPDRVVEALGLRGLPQPPDAYPITLPAQRVVRDYQQLFFVTFDEAGGPMLEKEYWLSRTPPRLVAGIIFRDPMGRVEMESQLHDYKPVGAEGVMLPHLIFVNWPAEQSFLEFRISRWKLFPEEGEDLPAFIPPDVRGQRFENEYIEE